MKWPKGYILFFLKREYWTSPFEDDRPDHYLSTTLGTEDRKKNSRDELQKPGIWDVAIPKITLDREFQMSHLNNILEC